MYEVKGKNDRTFDILGAKFIVVLIALVMIFKDQLTSLVKNILSKITKQSNSI